MKVFEIREEFSQIQELIENEEFDENGELINNDEIIKELLNGLELDRANKADNIAYLIKASKSSQEAIKSDIARLSERKTMFLNEENKLKELLAYLLHNEKLKTDKFTYFFKNTNSVHILDESLIPVEFLKVKETISVDKIAIKKKLADFEEIPGALLESKTSLIVK